ncbi:hypothetical protein Tco_1355622, partial [Tanacetum coccineum]
MEEYMTTTREDYGWGIARPKFDDKANFELKGQILKELRTKIFSGAKDEDPNGHIEKVLKIADLFHIPHVTQDQVMLRDFPMSLTRAASHWIRNEPFGSIQTWDALKKIFLVKYCPPARTTKKMEEINNFQQESHETLYQAWERFKDMLLRCPQYYLTKMQEVVLFYKALNVHTRQILDSKGVIPSMKAADAKKEIQEMVDHLQKWHDGISTRSRSNDTSDGLAAIQAQLSNLGREIKKVNKKVYAAQVGCEKFRATAPGFYRCDVGNNLYQEQRQTLEESLKSFMPESSKRHDDNNNLIKEIRSSTDDALRNQGASIKALKSKS